MDKKILFNKLITFTASVERTVQELSKDAKPDMVTPVQFSILQYITINKLVTLSQISHCEDISMSNASREIKKLENMDLIEKIDDIEDKRKQFIRLSRNGEIIMNTAFSHIESRFLNIINKLCENNLEDIYNAIDLLNHSLFIR
ncbi:regulatory protein MarR [Clostridium pasteurianum DSM 525 = ATCC 6013]|uniref:Regulatory protein MarR n=1 Tax=Clostridium pasteurianum DSM 525 = ATCC 6013 TaxID=1262449 RepID=A0A0H3JAX2_CLOPA|nr:helix-turn-helix domain-containing protein [Clostridium pasteurianum]AJA49948.1 regulatory protein MarR [Clostridium pasteurianum DSM 525 = ATCC 6013]AJA53936.1 regulatory protein MarR [Clostridium pasteurianum DSM 525 = ATCC 6013]AOZ77082.1 MarR family transcriptional regulator [Clostridium pasteurianum DSM 525 = ATCC 6013]AOZ80879.1 MarR family transcriptional regulator [Clostridium pasteurianum]ELP59340.1 regulatory protein MarR [Clostridium pasteurianum DSM 525 = ATCC 6013]